MKKFGVFGLLMLIAVPLAGGYGMIHNQISYTVSPEYFTKFKFHQFGLDGLDLPDRLRASLVGLRASWWMGIPIGLLVGLCGLIHEDARRMFRVSLQAFLVVIGFTLWFGLCGLGYGWLRTRAIDLADYQGHWFIPPDVVDLRRFLCAGYMHNSSYLGGMFAIMVAGAFQLMVRWRTKH